MRNRFQLWLIISVGLALWLGGCKPRETNVEVGNRTQTLHRGMGPALANLDPHLATGTTDYNVLSALFEGLVGEDPVDLSPVPGVAATWDVSPDGLSYTFHLRDDARWSNGDPVTATDFVASWQRALSPELGAEPGWPDPSATVGLGVPVLVSVVPPAGPSQSVPGVRVPGDRPDPVSPAPDRLSQRRPQLAPAHARDATEGPDRISSRALRS